MFLCLLGLGALVVAQSNTRVFQRPKLIIGKQSAPVQTKPPATGEKKTSTVDFIMVDRGLVTPSFIRMHHPEMLQSMVNQVQTGQIKQLTLDTLVPQTLQAGLFKQPPPAPKPTTTAHSKVRKITTGVQVQAYSPVSKYHDLAYQGLRVINVEHSPKEMKFPESWDKQTVTSTVHIISQTDGPVTASLGPRSPFYIRSMTAYDGYVLNARTRVGVTSKRKVASSTTHAPWTLTTNAGQDVDVTLGFSPKFDLFNFVAGYYKDTLTVEGKYWNPNQPKENPWSLDVPVSGRFNGILIGVVFFSDEGSATVITDPAYDPKVPQSVEIPVTIMNAGADANGTIVGDGLPAGVTMQSVPIYVPSGQTRHATLVFNIDRESPFYFAMTTETPIPIGAKFIHGNKSETVGLAMTCYKGVHEWTYDGSAGSVDFKTDFYLFSTGDFHFSIWGQNKNIVFGYDVQARGGFGAQEYVNIALSVDSDDSFSKSFGFNVAALKSNYLNYIHQPFHVRVVSK